MTGVVIGLLARGPESCRSDHAQRAFCRGDLGVIGKQTVM